MRNEQCGQRALATRPIVESARTVTDEEEPQTAGLVGRTPAMLEVYKMIARVADCDGRDVDRAVAAARRAFEAGAWRDMAPAGPEPYLGMTRRGCRRGIPP